METLIQKYTDMAVNLFLAEGGWRYASSLYMIGGFARDEETVAVTKGRLQIYNDMDMLVIIPAKTPRRLLGLHGVQVRANDGRLGFQVDFVVESIGNLRNPAPIIMNYDIQQYHKLLWGRDYLREICATRIAPNELSRSDALQLLLNRLASLLIGYSVLRDGKQDMSYLQVQISKPLLAMMCALLLSEGRYTVKVRDQLAMVEKERDRRASDLLWGVFSDEGLMALLRTAVDFKHSPHPNHFHPTERSIDDVARHFSRFLQAFMIRHYGLRAGSDIGDIIQVFRDSQPTAPNILRPGWWAARLRGSGRGTFLRGPHPQVEVYSRHLRWLSEHIQPRSEGSAKEEDVRLLISDWKASGFGCRIK